MQPLHSSILHLLAELDWALTYPHRVVYHVDTQEFRKITVPARLQRVWAYNTTINMTSWSAPELSEETSYRRIAEAISPKTLDEDIPFIWRWGESLREIQALPLFTKLDPEVTAHDKRVANVLAKYGFFYHPWRNDTSFRATSFLKLPKGKCTVEKRWEVPLEIACIYIANSAS